MATESLEVKDIVKNCKILLIDVEGTTTSISFVKDKLFPYVEENVQKFLEENWEDEAVKKAVAGLRKLAVEDVANKMDGVIEVPPEDKTKDEQIEALVKNTKWQMSLDRKTGALKTLQGLIWKQGYEKGEIKGHVYDDVMPALEQWRSVNGQKVYIYSSGSVQAQKLLFGQSDAGDMLAHIDGHFDTDVGGKREVASYKNIIEKIGCKAGETLFLTDIYEEAKAAGEAGLQTVLVVREGNAPLPEEAAKLPTMQSFVQLALAKKRKTEPEDEQPAKVAKTADALSATDKPAESIEKAEDKPKTSTENEIQKSDAERMDVDEEVDAQKVPTDAKEGSPRIVVEEVVEPSSPVAVAIDAAPAVVEAEDNKENIEMNEAAVVENGENERPIIEEIPPNENAFGENVQPVVEEPMEADIGVINVSDILGKQCDSMLLEISNMENLVADAMKPILESRGCEGASTNGASENGDSNDIVESILDKELEMEQEKAEKCEAMVVGQDMEVKVTDKEKTVADSDKIENKTEKTEDEVKSVDSDDKITGESVHEDKNDEIKDLGNVISSKPVEPEAPKVSEVVTGEDKSLEKVNDSKVIDSSPENIKATVPTESKEDKPKVNVTIDRESGEAVTSEETPKAPETEEKKDERIETDSKPKDENKITEESPQPSQNGNGEKPVNGDAKKDEELKERLAENGDDSAQNGTKEEDKAAESETKGIKIKSLNEVSDDAAPEQQIEQAAEV